MDNYELFELLLKAESEAEVDQVLKEGWLSQRRFRHLAAIRRLRDEPQPDQQPTIRRHRRLGREADQLHRCGADGGMLSSGHRSQRERMPRARWPRRSNACFKVKDGRLENLSAVAADGAGRANSLRRHRDKEGTLLHGRGQRRRQTPASFKDTFLSLTKQNKDDIPFVQGRFNCGGTGVLALLRRAQISAHRFAAASVAARPRRTTRQKTCGASRSFGGRRPRQGGNPRCTCTWPRRDRSSLSRGRA